MVNDIKIPFFSYEEIRNRADDFLRQYHPSRKIPVPIEEIIEFQMNIDIFPIEGLHTILDVDGFTISDLSTICVDDFVYKSRPGRYRFTLAHEVGHIVLHRNIYLNASFHNIQEWKDFINSISDKDHSWLEYHAYTFGGLVLVPGEHLIRLTEFYVNRIQKEDISLRENWDFAWDRIADQLAKDFEVSTQVIEKRLGKDKVRDLYHN